MSNRSQQRLSQPPPSREPMRVVDNRGTQRAPQPPPVTSQAGPVPALPPPPQGQPIMSRQVTPEDLGIEPPRDYPDPEWLTPELQQMADAMSERVVAQRERMGALQAKGIQPNPGRILEIKIEALLDAFFERNTKRGQYKRLEFEQILADRIDFFLSELDRVATAAVEQAQEQFKTEMWRKFLSGDMSGLEGLNEQQLLEIASNLGLPVPVLLKQPAQAAPEQPAEPKLVTSKDG